MVNYNATNTDHHHQNKNMAEFSPSCKLLPNPSIKLRASQLNEQNGATVILINADPLYRSQHTTQLTSLAIAPSE
jgi:hypothetical protein